MIIPEMWVSGSITFYRCGNCKTLIDKEQKYCPKCGKEIDWRYV